MFLNLPVVGRDIRPQKQLNQTCVLLAQAKRKTILCRETPISICKDRAPDG